MASKKRRATDGRLGWEERRGRGRTQRHNQVSHLEQNNSYLSTARSFHRLVSPFFSFSLSALERRSPVTKANEVILDVVCRGPVAEFPSFYSYQISATDRCQPLPAPVVATPISGTTSGFDAPLRNSRARCDSIRELMLDSLLDVLKRRFDVLRNVDLIVHWQHGLSRVFLWNFDTMQNFSK